MGRLVSFFTGKVALKLEPTPVSVPGSTPSPTPEPEAGSTPEPTPPSTVPIYVIREAGIAVDLACRPRETEHPIKHAMDLLHALMRDEAFAGQPATEKALKKLYTAISRSQGIKPFSWHSVVRHFNAILKLIYGPAYRKTYKRVYDGGRLRKRRVYRIPLLKEYEEAAGTPGGAGCRQVA